LLIYFIFIDFIPSSSIKDTSSLGIITNFPTNLLKNIP